MKSIVFGGLVGAVLGVLYWICYGWFVGLSDDWEIWRRYAPHLYMHLFESALVGTVLGCLSVTLARSMRDKDSKR